MRSSNVISTFILTFLAVFTLNIASTSAQEITVNARVYLEGALLNSFETGTTHDRPLMRDDLRDSPFDNSRHIPDDDIYQTPYVVNAYVTTDVTDKYTHVACGAYPIFQSIPDPVTVFSTTGEDAIVDWVFLELRDKNDYTDVVATRSALVQRDGDVVDLDGTSKVSFPDVAFDSYFLVVRHRNHLGVMTKFPKMPAELDDLIDFSDENVDVFDFANTSGEFNYSGYAMRAITVSGVSSQRLVDDRGQAYCYSASYQPTMMTSASAQQADIQGQTDRRQRDNKRQVFPNSGCTTDCYRYNNK